MNKYVFISVIAAICFFGPIAIAGETYQLSMLPRYSAEEILKRVTPLANHLSTDTVQVETFIISNFDQYLQSLKNGVIEIGYQNPYIYALASDSHEVIAMAVKGSAGDKFRGIIISRPDTQIGSLEELKGKKICYVGPTSAGGYLSQKLSLMLAGIDVEKDMELMIAAENKQENVIFAVYSGDADAGFIRESALGRATKFVPPHAITVVKRTAWLPNWAISVKRSLPDDVKKEIKEKLIQLKKNHPVLKALKVDALRSAKDSDYDSIRRAAGLLVD